MDAFPNGRYELMDAVSPAVFVYFASIVVLGGWFVINLFLAVIFQVPRKKGAPLIRCIYSWGASP